MTVLLDESQKLFAEWRKFTLGLAVERWVHGTDAVGDLAREVVREGGVVMVALELEAWSNWS